jgi:hypothetical protein
MSNTTTVTHPDGTISTRTSKSRAYTHAVVVSPAPAIAYAAMLDAVARTLRDKAEAFRAAAEAGHVTVTDRRIGRVGADDMFSHVAKLTGTDLSTWCSADGRTLDGDAAVPVSSYLKDYAYGMADDADRLAAGREALAAEIRDAGTPVGEWGVLRWSSRADLAAKAAAGEFATFATGGRTVSVVAVD